MPPIPCYSPSVLPVGLVTVSLSALLVRTRRTFSRRLQRGVFREYNIPPVYTASIRAGRCDYGVYKE